MVARVSGRFCRYVRPVHNDGKAVSVGNQRCCGIFENAAVVSMVEYIRSACLVRNAPVGTTFVSSGTPLERKLANVVCAGCNIVTFVS